MTAHSGTLRSLSPTERRDAQVRPHRPSQLTSLAYVLQPILDLLHARSGWWLTTPASAPPPNYMITPWWKIVVPLGKSWSVTKTCGLLAGRSCIYHTPIMSPSQPSWAHRSHYESLVPRQRLIFRNVAYKRFRCHSYFYFPGEILTYILYPQNSGIQWFCTTVFWTARMWSSFLDLRGTNIAMLCSYLLHWLNWSFPDSSWPGAHQLLHLNVYFDLWWIMFVSIHTGYTLDAFADNPFDMNEDHGACKHVM